MNRAGVLIAAAASLLGCYQPGSAPLPDDLSADRGHWFAHRWESDQSRLASLARFAPGAIVDGTVHLLELREGRRPLDLGDSELIELVAGGVPLPVGRAWKLKELDGRLQWSEEWVSEGPGGFNRLKHGLRDASAETCLELAACAVIRDGATTPTCVVQCTPPTVAPPLPPNTPCESPWQEIDVAGVGLCAPPGATDVLEFDDCPVGFVDTGHAPGSPGQCEEIVACPPGPFPSPPPGLPPSYVFQAAPPGGNGSTTAPYNSIPAALANGAQVVLLGAGDYTFDLGAVPSELSVIGLCPQQVRLRTSGEVNQDSLELRGVAIDATNTATGAFTLHGGRLALNDVVLNGPLLQTGGQLDMVRSLASSSRAAAEGSTIEGHALVKLGGILRASQSVFLGQVLSRGGLPNGQNDLIVADSFVRGGRTEFEEDSGVGIAIQSGSRAVVQGTRVMWFYRGGISLVDGRLELLDSIIWTSAGAGVRISGDFEDSTIERVATLRASVDVPEELESPAGVRASGPGVVSIKKLFTDRFALGVSVDREASVHISESWIAFGGNNGIDVSRGALNFEAFDVWVVSSFDLAPSRDTGNNVAALSIRTKNATLARVWIAPGGRHGIRSHSIGAVFEDIRILGEHSSFAVFEEGGAMLTRISNDLPGRGFDLPTFDRGGGVSFNDVYLKVIAVPTTRFAGGPHRVTGFVWEGCFEETNLKPGELELTNGEIRLLPECEITPGVWEGLHKVRLGYAD